MQDFNEYVKNSQNNSTKNYNNGDIFKLVNDLAKKFDGKNQTELLKAIYAEAEKGKRNGTLTNEQIDAFANMLSPLLDEKKLKILEKIVADIKKI